MSDTKDKEIITIKSRKFDGTVNYSWQAELIETNGSLLKFVGEFDKQVSHQHLGVISPKTVSYEFYWIDRWYNVFRFHEPDGSFRNFYCNVNLPPTFENKILDYIDLDIDVLVWKDFTPQILDMDEFEENARKFSYPNDLRIKAAAALDELLFIIENKIFPFDYQS